MRLKTLDKIPFEHRRILAKIIHECLRADEITQLRNWKTEYYHIQPSDFSRLNRSSIIKMGGNSSVLGFEKLGYKIALEEGVIPFWMPLWLMFSNNGRPIIQIRESSTKAAYARKDLMYYLAENIMQRGFYESDAQKSSSSAFGGGGNDYNEGAFTGSRPDAEQIREDALRGVQNQGYKYKSGEQGNAYSSWEQEQDELDDRVVDLIRYLSSLELSASQIQSIINNPATLKVIAALREVSDKSVKLSEIKAQLADLNLSATEIAAIQARPEEFIQRITAFKDAKEEAMIVAFLERQVQDIINRTLQTEVAQTQNPQQGAELIKAEIKNVNFPASEQVIQTIPEKVVAFDVQVPRSVEQAVQAVREGLVNAGFRNTDFNLTQVADEAVSVSASYERALELAGNFKFQNAAAANEGIDKGRGV